VRAPSRWIVTLARQGAGKRSGSQIDVPVEVYWSPGWPGIEAEVGRAAAIMAWHASGERGGRGKYQPVGVRRDA
jgi:hypothetical protein